MKAAIPALLFALVISPLAAAETKDDFVAMEKNAWKAWGNHDVKAYTDSMTENALQVSEDGNVYSGRDKIAAFVGSHTCKLVNVDISDANLRQPSADVAILTYTATQDMTCEGEKSPTKVISTAVYVRQGGKWRWANYQETAVK